MYLLLNPQPTHYHIHTPQHCHFLTPLHSRTISIHTHTFTQPQTHTHTIKTLTLPLTHIHTHPPTHHHTQMRENLIVVSIPSLFNWVGQGMTEMVDSFSDLRQSPNNPSLPNPRRRLKKDDSHDVGRNLKRTERERRNKLDLK